MNLTDDGAATIFDRLPLLPLTLADVPAGLRQALAQEGMPFRNRGAGAAEGRIVLYDSRTQRAQPRLPGQWLIDIDEIRRDYARDPFIDLLDESASRHIWRIGGLKLAEEIATIDKRALRASVLSRLRELVEHAGGLWLRVAPFPFPYRSAFNFRFDHDEHEADDFDRTLTAIAGWEGATSHFLSGSAYEGRDRELARLRDLDVGGHGYWHHTYADPEESRRNIARGLDVLHRAGLKPTGYVAPHGRYYPDLPRILEPLGITHSSEFGLAYDELPFCPPGGDVLQIPIHPVCLGLFLEAAGASSSAQWPHARAVASAVDYFRATIRGKYRAGEPVFLYGHPNGRVGRHPEFLRAVFETAGSFAALWRTTLSGFAAWWRVRSAVRLQAVRRDDEVVVALEHLPADYPLAIEYWRGRHVAVIPLESRRLRFAPQSLVYESREPVSLARPVRVDQPEGLRGRFKRLIDWEKVTPIEEIDGNTWRNWTKRTLRRWRD